MVDGDAHPPPQAAGETAPQAGSASSEGSDTVDARQVPQHVEAALLTSDRPLSAARLGEAMGGVSAKDVSEAIEALNAVYDDTGRSFRIESVAGGFMVMTRPQFAKVLAALNKSKTQSKLSPAALETLAIIAYKQPILRADLQAIRGVACGEVLRSLMDRHLVKITGRAQEIGRPMLYGTTQSFLEVFGLSTLKDLPQVEELHAKS